MIGLKLMIVSEGTKQAIRMDFKVLIHQPHVSTFQNMIQKH